MKHDIEREHLINDSLSKEVKFLEEESFYEQERNKRLPAIIKLLIPDETIRSSNRNIRKENSSVKKTKRKHTI
jgi:hypothetical protein